MGEEIYKSRSGVHPSQIADALNAFYTEKYHLVQMLADPDRQEISIDGNLVRRSPGTFTILVVRG